MVVWFEKKNICPSLINISKKAEDSLGLTLESCLDESNTSAAAKPPATLDISQSLIEKMGHMTPSQLKELIEEVWQLLSKLPTHQRSIGQQFSLVGVGFNACNQVDSNVV